MTRSVISAVLAVGLAAIVGRTGFGRSPAAEGQGTFPAPVIQEIVLDNGFRVVLVEDHRVPRVAASLWYRIGSVVENPGEHGAAHFLEHVVHQGTTTVGTKDFEAEKPILREIQEIEQELIGLVAREAKRLRVRDVFYDELAWATTPEIERLRQQLYALEDRQSAYREFWAEYNWYRRYGALPPHADPVPATTSKEHIQIDWDLPTQNVEVFFRLEADRMANAILRGWEAQRFTVLEQRLGRQGRRETRFDYEALEAVTGPTHPAYHPSGGHLGDFAHFNRQQMLRMYDDYFVPNNALLALVGDMAPDRAEALAERYFGRIPRGPAPPARSYVEAQPVPGGTIRLDWQEPLSPRVIIRHRIPAVGHPDRPAFDAVAGVLRSRLEASLMEEDRGSSVQVSASRRGSPASLDIEVSGRRDEDLGAIEAAILRQIERLEREPVETETIDQVRRALRFNWEQIRGARGSLAKALGSFEVMDGWQTLPTYMQARELASGADIQRVAARYLVPSNRIIGTSRRSPGRSVAPTISTQLLTEGGERE